VSPEGTARIRNAQDLLVFIENRDPGFTEKILARVQPDVRELMETASRATWIPLELDANFVDAIIAQYGPAEAEEMWFEYSSRFVKTPLQRALFDGAIRLFGLSVGTFVRIIPRVWGTSYKGAGKIDVSEKGEGWQRLHLVGMHPEMCQRPGYVILLRGLFRGMYRLAKCGKEDFSMELDPDARELHAEFHWE
jgi:hypothetical protein